MAEFAGLLAGAHDHLTCLCTEPLEHQRSRPACFLCTACLLTPSASAISCHDQPWWRALLTWSTSRVSDSLRSATTARSPTRASVLLAASARSVASVMLSIKVDRPEVVNVG